MRRTIMAKKKLSLLALLFLILTAMVGCVLKRESPRSPQLVFPGYILDEDKEVLKGWLIKHPELRLAVDSDCKCSQDLIGMTQWYYPYGRIYHPYYAVGDFNCDGIRDFAVALMNTEKKLFPFEIVIFNGPFCKKGFHKPSYVLKELNLEGGGLFYGPSCGVSWLLTFGPFETETDSAFVPKGNTYEYKAVIEYKEDGTVEELYPEKNNE